MSNEKVKVYDVNTGEAMEAYHVDARELVASGHYTTDNPNPEPEVGPDRAELEAKLTAAGIEFFDSDPTEALAMMVEDYENKDKQ